MSKVVVYASDIKLPSTVIGMLDGTEDFLIENPYFNVPGIKPVDKKEWLKPILDKKGGLFLASLRVYYKGINKVFTSKFVIGWTSVVQGSKVMKEYRINAPFAATESLKQKQKIMVSPATHEEGIDDIKLATLDWQFSMIQDVLCISKIFDINMVKYKGMDNNVFYKAFIDDVNKILKERSCKQPLSVEQIYIDS